jgi:hypothetical protein
LNSININKRMELKLYGRVPINLDNLAKDNFENKNN